MIDGVEIKKLKVIEDERGFLMEILRSDDSFFERFGQVYITCCKRGIAKAWHYHKLQDDFFCCVWGKARVVLYDARPKSKTKGLVEEFILESPPSEKAFLLKIPRGVVHGFTAYQSSEARIINIPNRLYNYKKPDEYRYPWNSAMIPYKWPKEVKKGG